MLLWQRKKGAVLVLVLATLVLSAGVAAWRFAIVLGQKQEISPEMLASAAPERKDRRTEAKKGEEKPPARVGQIFIIGNTKTRDEVIENPPARVGQIFIIGNTRTRDEVILKQVPLFPGGILSFPDIDAAEQNLARLKGLKSKPTVRVLDREGQGVFKDIEITVEDK